MLSVHDSDATVAAQQASGSVNQSIGIALDTSETWAARRQAARVGALSGMVAGLIAAIGSRVAMRVVALDGGVEPELTLGGTLFILIAGAVVGTPMGLLFIAVRRWLPGPRLAQGALFGGLSILLLLSLLSPLFLSEKPDLTDDLPGGNLPLAINVFVTPLALLGLTAAVVVERLGYRIVSVPQHTTLLAAGDIALAAIGLLGCAAIVFTVASIVSLAIQGG